MENIAGNNASDWEIGKNENGIEYYYNKITKVSQWNKPEALIEEEKRIKEAWIQIRKGEKTIYYNKITQQQQYTDPSVPIPQNSIEIEQKEQETNEEKVKESQRKEMEKMQDDDDDDDENDNEKDEEEKSEQESRQRLNNRRHATSDGDREAFLNLLKENNVKSRFDWKLILSSKHLDPRYQAIHPSERRKLFDQYIDEQYRLKRAKEIESLNKKKVSFMEMLDAQQLSLDARYIDVFKLIEHDKRMEDIDDEYLRLSYFDEYLDRKVRDHMEAQRKEEDLAKSQFTTLLETRYKQGWFSSESSWVDMKKKLLEANEHSLHESLAFEAWCEFQTKLSQQDLVQSRKQAKEKYYRALLWHELIKYHNHGVITCNSQFVDFEKIANSQIKLSKMINLVDHQDGPNAKHLFTAYREDLEDEYNIHRTMLHNILLGYKYMFVSTTTFDQFLSAIGRGAREQIPPCNLQIYFSEFTRHVQKLDRQKFFDYLKSIPKDTPLSDIQFDTLDHLKQKWYDEFHSGTIEGMVPRQRDSHPDDEEDVAPPLKKFKS